MTTIPTLPDRRLSPVERKEIIDALLQIGATHYPLQLLSWMQSPVTKIAENAALLCTHLPQTALADFIPLTEQLLKRSLSPLTAPQRRLLFTFFLRSRPNRLCCFSAFGHRGGEETCFCRLWALFSWAITLRLALRCAGVRY